MVRVVLTLLLMAPALCFSLTPEQERHENKLNEIARGFCASESINGKDYSLKFEADGGVRLHLLGRKGGELNGEFLFTKEEWEGRQRVLKDHQAKENSSFRDCVRYEKKILRETYVVPPDQSATNRYGQELVALMALAEVLEPPTFGCRIDLPLNKSKIKIWLDSIDNHKESVMDLSDQLIAIHKHLKIGMPSRQMIEDYFFDSQGRDNLKEHYMQHIESDMRASQAYWLGFELTKIRYYGRTPKISRFFEDPLPVDKYYDLSCFPSSYAQTKDRFYMRQRALFGGKNFTAPKYDSPYEDFRNLELSLINAVLEKFGS